MRIPDYMMRPEELEKFARQAAAKGLPDSGDGARSMLQAAAGGDKDVFDALWSFWNFSQAFDDLLDESGSDLAGKELAMTALHDWVVSLLKGKEHQPSLNRFCAVWDRLLAKCGWNIERGALAQKACLAFKKTLTQNPFVCRHSKEFRAMFVSAMLRCLAGDEMAASDKPERQLLAPAVRCGDLDVIFHAIYLARGFAAATEWSSQREYDCEPLTKGVS